MNGLTEDGRRLVEAVAARHGVGTDAVHHLLLALAAGGGRQAQFNHPDLGGMGQWSQGGMIMVGDMFNQGLKYRIDSLCNDLAGELARSSPFQPAPAAGGMRTQVQSQGQWSGQPEGAFGEGMGGVSLFVGGNGGSRWPAELGTPASAGSQNDLHYAVFPDTRRLAIDQAGQIRIFDTGDHAISGFAQQQGGGQSLTFTSQHGLVRVADLPEVTPGAAGQAAPVEQHAPHAAASVAGPAPGQPPQPSAGAGSADEIFSHIERLAELRAKDILTAAEFDAKKAELLARL